MLAHSDHDWQGLLAFIWPLQNEPESWEVYEYIYIDVCILNEKSLHRQLKDKYKKKELTWDNSLLHTHYITYIERDTQITGLGW